ncbi:unnamed protein product [Prorocentrum cordatum]|uniref:Uncharacterized protein n=1 Tax=Prorocentrum cordatum TaxID=2364126 RepID=A0ABN9UWT5_9DINO|nr:unnamed protein product [Polarella glacialis]
MGRAAASAKFRIGNTWQLDSRHKALRGILVRPGLPAACCRAAQLHSKGTSRDAEADTKCVLQRLTATGALTGPDCFAENMSGQKAGDDTLSADDSATAWRTGRQGRPPRDSTFFGIVHAIAAERSMDQGGQDEHELSAEPSAIVQVCGLQAEHVDGKVREASEVWIAKRPWRAHVQRATAVVTKAVELSGSMHCFRDGGHDPDDDEADGPPHGGPLAADLPRLPDAAWPGGRAFPPGGRSRMAARVRRLQRGGAGVAKGKGIGTAMRMPRVAPAVLLTDAACPAAGGSAAAVPGGAAGVVTVMFFMIMVAFILAACLMTVDPESSPRLPWQALSYSNMAEPTTAGSFTGWGPKAADAATAASGRGPRSRRSLAAPPPASPPGATPPASGKSGLSGRRGGPARGPTRRSTVGIPTIYPPFVMSEAHTRLAVPVQALAAQEFELDVLGLNQTPLLTASLGAAQGGKRSIEIALHSVDRVVAIVTSELRILTGEGTIVGTIVRDGSTAKHVLQESEPREDGSAGRHDSKVKLPSGRPARTGPPMSLAGAPRGLRALGGAAGLEAGSPLPVKAPPCAEDDDTTDAGSDRETVCTSAQASDSEGGGPRPRGRLLLPAGGPRRAPRFRGALATIPGTPVSRPPLSRPPGSWTLEQKVPRPGLPPPLGLPPAGGAAATPSQVLATRAPAREALAPQKVAVPEGAEPPARPLDPAVPAKKKPLLGLAPGAGGADRTMPMKKRVTGFLVQDAPSVLSAPGLRTASGL